MFLEQDIFARLAKSALALIGINPPKQDHKLPKDQNAGWFPESHLNQFNNRLLLNNARS
jgi:hypothetical protein